MQQRLIACAAALTALAASVREQSSPAHLAHAVATGFEHVAQTIEHGVAKAEAVAVEFEQHVASALETIGTSQAPAAPTDAEMAMASKPTPGHFIEFPAGVSAADFDARVAEARATLFPAA